MFNLTNLLNELGFEVNENKMKNFLDKSEFRNNLMKSDTIKGAFSKLSDKEKQEVVDSLNETQSFFDGIFGTNTKKWTVDDLNGAYVNVHKETPSNTDSCNCNENCNCKIENNGACTCDGAVNNANANIKNNIASALRAEALKKRKEEEKGELIKAVVDKAVEKFSNTVAHEYVIEETKNGGVVAFTYVKLLRSNGSELVNDAEFVSAVKKRLTELTGAKSASVQFTDKGEKDGNYLKLTIAL